MHHVLVEHRSSTYIIFSGAFDKLGIGKENLELVKTHLLEFSSKKVFPLGSIQLVLTLGEPPCQTTTTTRFFFVVAPLAYNMILGRPSLNSIKAIPSAYHLLMKISYREWG